ncbi:alanine racemase [Microcella alkalica]|uniref:alanine racemase n=1 Tax=Microcella alkalica TaxID=355930 RepID=UPI00145E0227|nr:alanine racemase [Microcella alkalica]
MNSRPFREARISVDAIARNVVELRRLAPTKHLMAVVKADGYGHGAVTAARAALEAGADHLGVADIHEALELRRAGIDAPVLAWLHDPAVDLAVATEAGIALGVSSRAELERAAAAGHRPVVHVKVDTGLSRNGVVEADWGPLVDRLAELVAAGALRLEGVFSHLSNTSADDDAAQLTAFARFLEVLDAAGLEPGIRHLAASAAAFDHPAARFDMVRAGIALYGVSPALHLRDLPLRPAMELSAAIVSVKRVPAGSGVSYGYLHRTEGPTTLALVPLGYADGVPRHALGAPVLIGDTVHRVAGRIAMDQFVVDVGDQSVAVGERAVLFGDPRTGAPTADAWADAAGTIGYEIVTRLGRRVERTSVRRFS